MAVSVYIHWPDVTPELYDEVRRLVNWEGDPPKGGQIHIATFDEKAAHIVDVWESAEDFQSFVDNRLMPGVQQLSIASQPEVQVTPVHALFTPGFQPKS